jgi:hypothetical protein
MTSTVKMGDDGRGRAATLQRVRPGMTSTVKMGDDGPRAAGPLGRTKAPSGLTSTVRMDDDGPGGAATFQRGSARPGLPSNGLVGRRAASLAATGAALGRSRIVSQILVAAARLETASPRTLFLGLGALALLVGGSPIVWMLAEGSPARQPDHGAESRQGTAPVEPPQPPALFEPPIDPITPTASAAVPNPEASDPVGAVESPRLPPAVAPEPPAIRPPQSSAGEALSSEHGGERARPPAAKAGRAGIPPSSGLKGPR